ncbi:MAG: hypothetical protein HKN40_07105 [Winogradskyella sp.]|uniref:hypothetical protein n=1 Tax=Winogradskyella sp. TaxID=1883156 RepID=UPI00182457FA|nr:hypothetical protein [Winogradskyella sp.]
MSSRYYILEKNTFEGLSLKLPTEQFDESVLECEELGAEPFTYNTIEEALHVKSALNLIFKKTPKSSNFIIVKEVTNE